MSIFILRNVLSSLVDKIDTGECNLSETEINKAVEMISSLTVDKTKLSKYQACKYLNVSRATFDNLVKTGSIPKGKKEQGFKELFWYKEDLAVVKISNHGTTNDCQTDRSL